MLPNLETTFAPEDKGTAVPLVPVARGGLDRVGSLTARDRAWASANGFTGAKGGVLAISDGDGGIAKVLFGVGEPDSGDPSGPNALHIGRAPSAMPDRDLVFDDAALAAAELDPSLAAIAWGLGAYRFRRFKAETDNEVPRLVIPATADRHRVMATVRAVHFGRDLINTPANEMGPEEISQAVQALADVHGAAVTVHRGEDDTFAAQFPLIHAVGRASTRPARLVDLTWGDPEAQSISLIGKGIAFDTGGLDLKPASAMLLMKKDMGGAAAAIAAADIIMALGLPVRLRLLIATAENAVSGNAFRPGDVIRSRAGMTVEIGNTDAEGRLVLADAMALADEAAPDVMMTFATLTGAARVALGPDLPAFFSTDETFAQHVASAGFEMGDPVWRMPFWRGYDRLLEGQVADISNVSEGPFAGAITAALFLKRFVRNAGVYAHADLYGWRQAGRALGPRGGETHTARAVAAAVERMVVNV